MLKCHVSSKGLPCITEEGCLFALSWLWHSGQAKLSGRRGNSSFLGSSEHTWGKNFPEYGMGQAEECECVRVQQERKLWHRTAWDTSWMSKGQMNSLASELVESERLPEDPEDTSDIDWSQNAPGLD